MKYLKIIIIFFLLFFSYNVSAITNLDVNGESFQPVDLYLYYGNTANNIKIGWNNGENYNSLLDKFEVVIYNPERNINIPIAVNLTENFLTFKCPKTGHWIVKVRTKRINEDETIKYSSWAESINSDLSTVDDSPRGWWLFTWIKSTGPIITKSK